MIKENKKKKTKPVTTFYKDFSTFGTPTITMTAQLGLCFLILAANWAAAAEDTYTDNEEKSSSVLSNIQLQKLSSQLQQQSERLDQLQRLSTQQQQQSEHQSQHLKSLQGQVDLMEGIQEGHSVSIGALNSSSYHKQAAFTVTYSSFKSLNVGTGGTLKYDTIITDIGNGYTPLTGHFAAPYPGLYAFFACVRKTANRREGITLGIYKDEQILVSFTTEGAYDPWDYGVAFTTAHLRKGESAYVKHTGWGDTFLEAGPFTSFSGLLVAAD